MKRIFLFLLLSALAAASAGHSAFAQKGKDGKDRWVTVVNGRSSDMMRLYWSGVTTDDWEGNKLLRPIEAGSSRRIEFDDGTGACLFDVRAVFKDNLQVQIWRINVCREEYWQIED